MIDIRETGSVIENALLNRREPLFIDGGWRAPREPHPIVIVDPSTEKNLAEIEGAGPRDVAAAVTAAHGAFPAWRRMPAGERGGYLAAFAGGLQKRAAELTDLQMRNNGKPRVEAEIDVGDAVATFEYYAGLAKELEAHEDSPVDLPDPGYRGETRFDPLGVVGMIVPWNFPLVTSAWKIAPALAAGCTVVLKTSEYTPLIELAYGDIAAEAGLPRGVLNLLTGAGVTGAAITGDPRLGKLSFTGSNAVGSKVMGAAAARCVPVSLELGGKSPIVVFDDADLDQAVECVSAGIFFNCGQMCSATSRLLVQEGMANRLLEALVEHARAIRVGSPFDDGVEMGPQTTRPQYEKVLDSFERAKNEDVCCVCGGEPIPRGEGFFVAPTIYADVPLESFLWREEIFGPVLAVRSFEDEAQAVELANDSEFGLVAAVVSEDLERAERVAAQLETGHIWINSPQIIFPQTAWGGFKASGIGRELGPWGLHAFLGVKHISVRAR